MVKRRILVVDDDREFAQSIALRCRSIGFEADAAFTPLAAIVKIGSRYPDLLCLDVNMPSGNGLDLCEYLIRDASKPARPVIMITGSSDEATFRRSLLLRTRYVRKSPNFWQRLQPVIEELLGVVPALEATRDREWNQDSPEEKFFG